MKARRGEIYWASLSPRSGSEQKGRRPVVVVSHDAFNDAPGWRSIIVVPLSTARVRSRHGPTVIALPEGSGGLKKPSIVLCHQVTTLDRAKLTSPIGSLDSWRMQQVSAGLKAAMNLGSHFSPLRQLIPQPPRGA